MLPLNKLFSRIQSRRSVAFIQSLFIRIQKELKEKHNWIYTYMYMVKQRNKNKKAWKTKCRSDLTEQLSSNCCKDINGSWVKL